MKISEKPPTKTKAAKAQVGCEGFKFGCDPELFIVSPEGNFVSAEGIIPGTKKEPHPVEYGAVQRDGFAAEFNIDPVTTFADWNRNIKAVIGQLEGFLPKGHKLVAIPAVRFDKEVFDAASPDVKALGCQPDFDAWSGRVNPSPKAPNDPYLRTGSGHVHIGWTEDADCTELQHILNCHDLVQQLDWFLGAWSVLKDSDTTRRKLYGKAGACRYKPYGVEYRVLSNFWVLDKELRQAVWDRMQLAIRDMPKYFLPDYDKASSLNVISSINEGHLYVRGYDYPIRSLIHDPWQKTMKVKRAA